MEEQVVIFKCPRTSATSMPIASSRSPRETIKSRERERETAEDNGDQSRAVGEENARCFHRFAISLGDPPFPPCAMRSRFRSRGLVNEPAPEEDRRSLSFKFTFNPCDGSCHSSPLAKREKPLVSLIVDDKSDLSARRPAASTANNAGRRVSE